MIIFGFGKITKKIIGALFSRQCSHCNELTVWNLCIVRTWFTLFFIPVIPYNKMYCLMCENCSSYIKLTKEEFEKYSEQLQRGKTTQQVYEEIKYAGKNETQINYLKEMENARKNNQ